MTARANTTGKKIGQPSKLDQRVATPVTGKTPEASKATPAESAAQTSPGAAPTTRTTAAKTVAAAAKKATESSASRTGAAAKTVAQKPAAAKAAKAEPNAARTATTPAAKVAGVKPVAAKAPADKPATARAMAPDTTSSAKTTGLKPSAAKATEDKPATAPATTSSARTTGLKPSAAKASEDKPAEPKTTEAKPAAKLSPALAVPPRATTTTKPATSPIFAGPSDEAKSTETKPTETAASPGSAAALPRTTTTTGDTTTKAPAVPGTPASTSGHAATPAATTPAATAPARAAATASIDTAALTPEATSPSTKPQTPAIGTAETKPATPVAEPMPRATPSGPEAPEATVGTDAAFASTVPCPTLPHTLRNISEVRHFFRTNDVPIFFIGATPFNLLGLDRWVRNFTYVSYYDAWDGAHPRVFTPAHKPYREFGSGEEINNWLLLNPEVRARMTKDLRPGVRPKVAMVFFDTETEQICEELGYDLILPSAALRHRLDSKITTTVLGNEAGVSSVPNVLGTGSDYKTLRAAADAAGLGDELVVQTPYGDSGKTTFFINSEADWEKHGSGIVGEEIKIMRRINNLPVAVEAVLTRSGTLVGPFLTELAGHADLTPYPGGWCGNEMHPDVFTDSQRTRATELVKRMGDRLAKEGYRGFFEVDVLVDTDSDEVYLGELNPRISGASAITNVTAGAYADVPLFLFHLLEYMDVEFELDIEEINERWEALSGADVWSQMVIKETSETLELLTATPATGQYHLDANGALVFGRAAMDWHMLQNESEAFFLRVYGPGDYRWKGGDLGILVTKGRLQVERNGSRQLSIRARHFIDSIRAGFAGLPLGGAVLEQEIRSDGVVEVNVHADGTGIGVQSRW